MGEWKFGRAAAFGVAAALAAAPLAPAAPKDASGGWVRWPSEAERAGVRPAAAKPGVFVRAVARCAVEATGELSGCRVVRETPTASGAGQALLALTPKFRRKPPGKNDLKEVNVTGSWYDTDSEADWVRRPSAEDLLAVFPSEAFKRGVSGYATIDCVGTTQGALTDCVAIEESPGDMGFGGAAIALTAQFMMKPARFKGAPVQSVIRVPIRFITYGPAMAVGSKRVLPPNLAWAEAPSYADVVAAYPKKARDEKMTGRATVSCNMSPEGRLTTCSIVSSAPRGYGFDTAAKALAKRFRYEITKESDKAATRSVSVHLPVTFDAAMLDHATPVIGKPNWASIPTADQMRAVFAALAVKETVRVTLTCVVQPGGTLAQCASASEQPVGVGAGVAALTLVPAFRLTTWTAEGLPTVGGSIRIPLRYEPGPAAEAPTAK
jgi:TonB family protein